MVNVIKSKHKLMGRKWTRVEDLLSPNEETKSQNKVIRKIQDTKKTLGLQAFIKDFMTPRPRDRVTEKPKLKKKEHYSPFAGE